MPKKSAPPARRGKTAAKKSTTTTARKKDAPTPQATPREKRSTAVARHEAASVPDRSMQERMQSAAGRGLETIGQGDLALPFLSVLQALSPQVTRGHEKYDADAQAGDLYNTVTGELWAGDEGVRVIPSYYEKVYNVWTKRDEGGGFGGSFNDRLEAEEACDEETQDVVDTGNHYCLVEQDDGSWGEVVFSCSSTKLTASRRWNTVMKQQKMGEGKNKFTPPSYARTYRIKTALKTNDQGSFYVPVIETDAWVDDGDVFEQAENFYLMFAEQGARLAGEAYEAAEGVEVEVEEADEDPEVEY
jgi:hypothetical protein